MDKEYIIQQLRKRASWEKDDRVAAEKRGDVAVAAWHDGREKALAQVADEIEKGVF